MYVLEDSLDPIEPCTKFWLLLLKSNGQSFRAAWRDHKALIWPKVPTEAEVDWERQQVAHLLSIAASEYAALRAGELEKPWANLVLLSVLGGLEEVDWGYMAGQWIR